MSETTRTIEELSRVHEAIRHYVMEAGKSIDDLVRLSSQCSSVFDPDQCRIVSDSQFSLKHALQYLREGVEDHRQRESLLLRPLIGEALMKAVDKERSEITKQFEVVTATLKDADLSRLSPEDLQATTKRAIQAIGTFSNLVDAHSRKMDVILEMLRNST